MQLWVPLESSLPAVSPELDHGPSALPPGSSVTLLNSRPSDHIMGAHFCDCPRCCLLLEVFLLFFVACALACPPTSIAMQPSEGCEHKHQTASWRKLQAWRPDGNSATQPTKNIFIRHVYSNKSFSNNLNTPVQMLRFRCVRVPGGACRHLQHQRRPRFRCVFTSLLHVFTSASPNPNSSRRPAEAQQLSQMCESTQRFGPYGAGALR